MTEQVVRFHLRSVGSQWGKPMISTETMGELQRQRLIERSQDGTAIRLTENGSQQMYASQPIAVASMNHSRTTSAPRFQRRQGRTRVAPRGFV